MAWMVLQWYVVAWIKLYITYYVMISGLPLARENRYNKPTLCFPMQLRSNVLRFHQQPIVMQVFSYWFPMLSFTLRYYMIMLLQGGIVLYIVIAWACCCNVTVMTWVVIAGVCYSDSLCLQLCFVTQFTAIIAPTSHHTIVLPST